LGRYDQRKGRSVWRYQATYASIFAARSSVEDTRLLVDAHDVLGLRRLVVEAEYIVALLAKLVVVRCQIHLLPMRLEVRILQDATHRALADLDPFAANVLAEQRSRPVSDWQSYVARQPTGFSFDPGCITFGERKIGRPDLEASASLPTQPPQTFATWTPTNINAIIDPWPRPGNSHCASRHEVAVVTGPADRGR
jgi:hypothetical protein